MCSCECFFALKLFFSTWYWSHSLIYGVVFSSCGRGRFLVTLCHGHSLSSTVVCYRLNPITTAASVDSFLSRRQLLPLYAIIFPLSPGCRLQTIIPDCNHLAAITIAMSENHHPLPRHHHHRLWYSSPLPGVRSGCPLFAAT